MSREKEIEDGKYVSFYIGSSHISELDLMLKVDNTYKNRSALLRHLIEEAYSEKMSKYKTDLVGNRKALESQIQMIDTIELIDQECLDKVVIEYKKFKANIPLEHMIHSEEMSKKYIGKHLKPHKEFPGYSSAFPNASVDEMYTKLESLIKDGLK